jgi:glutathione S-transferase
VAVVAGVQLAVQGVKFMTMTLVIGNKNYSSWSMRPWLALRGGGIAFEERLIPLYVAGPADKQRILDITPAGKVPALIDGDVTVWDSLAIIEYVSELWTECRRRSAGEGPFLFGSFTAADAMYAPVIHRFRTYAIEVTSPVQEYMDAMMALPAFRQWTEEGLTETLVIEKFEID